jgi:hypothetical protein
MLYKLARSRFAPLRAGENGAEYDYSKADFVRDSAEQLITFTALGVVMALAHLVLPDDDEPDLPRITGTRPLRPGKAELAYRTAPPMSIRLGKRDDGSYNWVSYEGIEPLAVTLGTTVDLIEMAFGLRDGLDPLKAIEQAIKSVMGQVEGKTFLRGLGDIIKVVKEPVRMGPRWVGNFITSWVPNIIRSTARAVDPTLRNMRYWGDSEIGGVFWNRAAARIRQGAFALPPNVSMPKIDLWGRPIDKGRLTTGSPRTACC